MLKYPILAGGRSVTFSAGGYLPYLPSKEGIRNLASSCQCACAPAVDARNFQCSWGFPARFRIGSCLWTEFAILLMRGIGSRYAEIKRATSQVVNVHVVGDSGSAQGEAVKRKKYFDWEQAFHFIWQNADREGIWLGDAASLAAEFDVSEDAGAEVLDHLRARRLIEKLYTGKYIIVSWRDRDHGDSTRHSIPAA